MPHTVVIFGASGDLTSRKLVPALYNLLRAGSLPPQTRIVGFSRTPLSDDEWRASLRESTTRHVEGGPPDDDTWSRFAAGIHYQPGDIGRVADLESLRERLAALEGGRNGQPRLLPGHGTAVLRTGGRRPRGARDGG